MSYYDNSKAQPAQVVVPPPPPQGYGDYPPPGYPAQAYPAQGYPQPPPPPQVMHQPPPPPSYSKSNVGCLEACLLVFVAAAALRCFAHEKGLGGNVSP